MDRVLASVPRWADKNVLVGFDTADDAGVYKLTAELALVQTVDFFTPIVDDPYTYGAIAAANSLSDVYAMGGRPISALSILAWPPRMVQPASCIFSAPPFRIASRSRGSSLGDHASTVSAEIGRPPIA